MYVSFRLIGPREYEFLKEMLYEALFVPDGQSKFPKSIMDSPEIRKYVEEWNQHPDDLAIVAVYEDEFIGAIWGRRFEEDKKGYGYVDAQTPEISMAIKKAFRNQGIGRMLLQEIEKEYSNLGVCKLSLSVDKRNPAARLYYRCGYEIFEEQGTAITLVKELAGID